jgi:hypothetical protein
MPGIVFAALEQERRGWPGRSPAMTKTESFSGFELLRQITLSIK